ncbi:MAG: hypothetical protein RL410_142 [Actinomycetota bacterium]
MMFSAVGEGELDVGVGELVVGDGTPAHAVTEIITPITSQIRFM